MIDIRSKSRETACGEHCSSYGKGECITSLAMASQASGVGLLAWDSPDAELELTGSVRYNEFAKS